jgi:hypothetical protein
MLAESALVFTKKRARGQEETKGMRKKKQRLAQRCKKHRTALL